MVNIPFLPSTSFRQVAYTPPISLHNRYAEQNPILNSSPASLISRPSLKRFTEVGTGHIRKVFPSEGAFNNDAFVVSGTDLYRVDSTLGGTTLLGVVGQNVRGDVSMAIAAEIEESPPYLFVVDDSILWVYTEDGRAIGHLEAAGAIANNDTISINGVYYKWTSGSVDADPSASGSVANPWLVKLSGAVNDSLYSMFLAINAEGVAGNDYTSDLTAHTTAQATAVTATDLYVEAIDHGSVGNGYVLTDTGANLSWDGATMSGGGTESLRRVVLPDDAGAISLAHINSYIIVIPEQTDNLNTIGKFYWIEPGETRVDPLNFATAERSPDGLHQVITYGDMFWLFGQKTTEPWITTGDPTFPVQRYQGILFDRGSWSGTAVKVKDRMMVVDEDGGVFEIAGGQKRVSTPGIEEIIRKAIEAERLNSLIS